MSERRIGHFLIGRHLGQGLSSNCFQATNEETGAVCALKILRPQIAASNSAAAEAFLSAGDLTQNAPHPGLAKILSSGREGNSIFIEREFISAPTLRQYVQRYGALDPEFCAHIGALLSAMTNFAHSRNGGVAHGGISPHNVFIKLTPGGASAPALADYGAAAAAMSIGAFSLQNFSGEFGFFAPEIIAGDAPSPRSDVFSIGAVLYEMLSGSQPFSAADNSETIRLLSESNPLPIRDANPSAPAYLENVIFKCLAKNPDRRFSSPAELAAELRKPEATVPAVSLFTPEPETQAPRAHGAYEEGAAPPFLHLENNSVKLDKSAWRKIVILNPGDSTLTGSVGRAQGLTIKPTTFSIEPDGREEILVRPSFAPPLENEFFIFISSNGGEEKVKVSTGAELAASAEKKIAGLAASVAVAAAGTRLLWGIAAAPGTSPAWMIIAVVFALCAAGAALTANQGLAIAGSLSVLLGAWTLLNFEPARMIFAAAAAGCLLPPIICRFATAPIAKKTSTLVAALAAPLLFVALAFAAGDSAAGASPLSFLSGPPFYGIERRSTENTAMSEFRTSSYTFGGFKKRAPEEKKPGAAAPKAVSVIITGETANVRSGPGTNYKILTSVKKDRYFDLIEEKNGWMKIKVPGGGEGWVSAQLAAKQK